MEEACTAGTWAPAGASTCSNCTAGTYSGTNASACIPCGRSTYSAVVGSTTCQPCPGSTWAPEGSIACFECSPGQHLVEGACTDCPAGQSTEVNAECTDCGVGKYSITDRSSCEECPPGEYQNETGQDTCRPFSACPFGKYYTFEEGVASKESDRNLEYCDNCQCDAGSYVVGPMCQGDVGLVKFDKGNDCQLCDSCSGGRYHSNVICTGNGMTDVHLPCRNCTECAVGETPAPQSSCGAAQDTTCKACADCEPGSKSVCIATGYQHLEGPQCIACTACNVGEYISNGCPDFVAGGANCTACAMPLCSSGTYWDQCSGTSSEDDSNCTDCSACASGTFFVALCQNGAKEHECGVCETCAGESDNYTYGAYMIGNCAVDVRQTECGACKACSSGEYIRSKCNGTGISDIPDCAACPTCQPGQYITACAGNGTHSQASSCDSCDVCPAGLNRTGCDGTGLRNEPVCRNCTNTCPRGQSFSFFIYLAVNPKLI
jgi:hypothetical protein